MPARRKRPLPPLPSVALSTWEALAIHAGRVAEAQGRGQFLLLRGQAQDWSLLPSLARVVPKDVSFYELQRAERDALQHFQSQAHLHPEFQIPQDHVNGSREFVWWAQMQHYGAPTRLLDWTTSPYVAAYFAAEQAPEHDGVVLVIDGAQLNRHFREGRGEAGGREFHRVESDPPGLFTYTLERKSHRLLNQQGHFTIATHPAIPQEELLKQAGATVSRWVVPAALKSSLLRHLRAMNVSAQTLFPGLDGLGRSTGEIVKTLSQW